MHIEIIFVKFSCSWSEGSHSWESHLGLLVRYQSGPTTIGCQLNSHSPCASSYLRKLAYHAEDGLGRPFDPVLFPEIWGESSQHVSSKDYSYLKTKQNKNPTNLPHFFLLWILLSEGMLTGMAAILYSWDNNMEKCKNTRALCYWF